MRSNCSTAPGTHTLHMIFISRDSAIFKLRKRFLYLGYLVSFVSFSPACQNLCSISNGECSFMSGRWYGVWFIRRPTIDSGMLLCLRFWFLSFLFPIRPHDFFLRKKALSTVDLAHGSVLAYRSFVRRTRLVGLFRLLHTSRPLQPACLSPKRCI